jgi:tripartite-type tricarboxylate transporter receptor subunit TctC
MQRRQLLRTVGVLLSAAGIPGLAANAATAQDVYPNRPIRLIVPFPPGGPADVMGRLVAQALSTTVGQVIVENRPGAGATLGGKSVATAEPDGNTLLLGGSGALTIGPALYPNAGYDPRTAFVAVAMFSDAPYVMIGAMNAPFSNVQELLAYAKQNPGAVNFGVPNGAPPHMLAEMFKARTGADVQIVPYRGANTLITDMMAGRIHAGFETTSVMLGHLGDGKIRGLAVLRDTRLPQLADVPTMVESGVTDVSGSSWICVSAPAGTPQAIVERLRSAIVAGATSPEIGGRLKMMAAETKQYSPSELAAFIASEYQRVGAILRRAGVKAQ